MTLKGVKKRWGRGQQLKEVAQFDTWLRDGSAAHVESLCDWR